MAHVFISYSKQNKEYARRLVNTLRDQGFDVWIDDRELRASADWWRSIVLALRNCGAFIVIMTPQSDNSDWVQREVTLALKYDKPIFPLWLDGSIDTPNWEVFVRTQYADVRGSKMPEEKYFAALAEVVTRRPHRGEDVTQTHKVDKVDLDDDDEVFQQAVANPPQPTMADVFSASDAERTPAVVNRPGLPRWWPLVAVIGAAVVLIAIVALSNPPTPPVTPTPTTVPDITPDVTAAPDDLRTSPASAESLNAWRSVEGYPVLTRDTTLDALAQAHLAYLISLPSSDLPATNLYLDEQGRDIQAAAEEAGYAAPESVAMFVEVRDGDFSLDDLLFQMEIQGSSDLQSRAREYGFAQERSVDTNKLYFVLVVGVEG